MGADFLAFLEDRSYDPDAICVMGDAYDLARKMLHDKGQPHIVLEVIAQNIIKDFTMTGDRDPGRLAQRALRTFGIEADDHQQKSPSPERSVKPLGTSAINGSNTAR